MKKMEISKEIGYQKMLHMKPLHQLSGCLNTILRTALTEQESNH